MPYGVTAAQGVLDAGAAAPRHSDSGKSSSSFKVPGFGGSSNSINSKGNHFRGDTRSTSTSFTGVMQALLKPSRSSAASAAAAKPESPERPHATFRPRSALDLSGHSFSKTMKAEISRSKVALKTNNAQGAGAGAGGIPKHGWWDTSGGLGMDDTLSRPSSAHRGAGSYAADPSRTSHLRVPPRAPRAAGTGGSTLQHQQRQRLQQQQQQQQQQQSMSMCRPRSYVDASLDELSRAVGLQ